MASFDALIKEDKFGRDAIVGGGQVAFMGVKEAPVFFTLRAGSRAGVAYRSVQENRK